MILIVFTILMLIVGGGLAMYEKSLDKEMSQRSCYDILLIKSSVRAIQGMLVSESMLDYKRNKVSRKNSKF